MRTYFRVILFLFVTSLISCKKLGRGYVEGVVSETGTENPIEGATITLKYWKSHCAECPYLYDSVHTGSDGSFILYFKRRVNHQYELYVREKSHLGNYTGDTKFRISEKRNYFAISLHAPAYFKVRVKKTGNSNRTMSGNLPGTSAVFSLYHKGSPIDTLLPAVTRIKANVAQRVNWTLFTSYPDSPSNVQLSADTIVAKNDTLVYTIQYD
ncbi:MAG: hypothetical protein V4635_13030 [Bacteroidota bacterium]